jgi:hypothetical protein
MSYTVAITRIALTSTNGIYRRTGRSNESTFEQGTVTLNVVNTRLNSVTVKRGSGKAKNIPVARLSHLGLGVIGTSEQDALTFQAFVR